MERETTDITLFVRTSKEENTRWDRQKIVDALLRETTIAPATAEEISREVEKQILSSGISLLTSSLVREIVDVRLIERGLEQAGKMHARIGFPVYDVSQLILRENKENANLPHSPEGTNLILAEGIKKEYALIDVFTPEVAEAHVMGDIHIHSLGHIDRPYSSCQSLEYLKKFGLNLPHALTVAKPAKHAEVLLAHMVRFSATLQGHFAGVIAWDAINYSFAPYLTAMNEKELQQFAQMLIYEFSQLTSARGGQSMFTDIHLYWELPPHLAGVPALGPGEETLGRTYGEFQTVAQRFAVALFDVFRKGDASGRPFIFPRPLVHISERFFETSGSGEFLKHVCTVAGEKGNSVFVFDRENLIRHSCGSMKIARLSGGHSAEPWGRRYATIQNVTLNLPRLGYRAARGEGCLMDLITANMERAAQAHSQKRDFLEKILSYGETGPLAMLTMKNDGFSYLRMKQAAYLIGFTGLDELVQTQSDQQLHEPAGFACGQKFIAHLETEALRLGRLYDMSFVLEQTPAESTSYRFARLDLKYFSPEAGHFVKGDISTGAIYYTNSSQLAVSAPVTPKERIEREGSFHRFIKGGVMTNIWLGSHLPDPDKMLACVIRAFQETQSGQLVFSPEFITCGSCAAASRGLSAKCPVCGSKEVAGVARIAQYFSRTSGWNKGKLAELRDRNKHLELLDI